MSPYLDLFVSEARKHLSAFGELIIRLEISAPDPAVIGELFRQVHSIKGMAATMRYEQIGALAHTMEKQLGLVQDSPFRLQPALADLLVEGSDALGRLVAEIESGSGGFEDTAGLIERLAAFNPAAAGT